MPSNKPTPCFPPQLVLEMTPPQEEYSPLRNNTQASHTLHSKLRSITHARHNTKFCSVNKNA